MTDPILPGVPAHRLGRRPKQLLAALALVAGAATLHLASPTPTTTLILKLAMVIAAAAPLLRVMDNRRHADGGVRLAAWTAAGVLLGALVLIGWIGHASELAALVVFSGALVGGWLLIGVARLRWLARAAARPRGTTLSVSVICKDEADRIGRCLEAVAGWADQVVVLDSGSSDGTADIARRFTSDVSVTDWPGYGPQKQRALERCSSQWVLSLDADEVISPALKREIDATLALDHGCSAFKNPWVTVLFGGPIDFGADGRYHTRLFRRDAARFDGAAVHEEVVASGRAGMLEAPVYHYSFRDRAHLDRKFAEYARLSAESRFARGKRSTRAGALLRGAASFVLLYVLRLGLLDGRRGLLMAALYARYTHDKYAGLVALEAAAR